MARPRTVSDEQILRTTRKAVLRDGPGISLDDVAAELGVTQPALLKRFGSKQTLLIAALKPPSVPEWTKWIEGLPDGRSLKAQLSDTFAKMGAFMEEMIPCITALRMSGIPEREALPDKGVVVRIAYDKLAAFLDRLKQ